MSDQRQAVTGVDGLRREWREGRIRLDDLPAGTRRLATIALALIAASCAVLVARALGLPLPGGTIDIPSKFVARTTVTSLPALAVVVVCLGLGTSVAALALAVQRPGRRLGRIGLLGIAVLGLALSSQQVGEARDLRRLEDAFRPNLAAPALPASSIIEVAGWLGIVGALVALLLAAAGSSGRLRTPLLAAAAAAPIFLTAGVLGIVGYEAFDLGPDASAGGIPRILSAQSYVAPSIMGVAGIVGVWLVPLLLWQAVAWARASRREIGLRVASGEARLPGLLIALLTLKIGWLVLGYASRLPQTLGGASPVWQLSLADGIPAWLIALSFAGLAGWWLASPGAVAVSERGFISAALIVTIGFSLVTVVMSLALAALPVAGLLPSTNLPVSTLAAACQTTWLTEQIGNAARCAIDRLTDAQLELTILSQLLTLALALGLGLWLWRRHTRRSIALFLIAAVLWAAPRIPDALGGLLHLAAAPSVAPELVTFDTVLTAVLAALAVLWYAGRQRGSGPGTLLLVLTVSTLLVHSGTLVPDRLHSVLFFLALLFPVAYELLLDSEDLNQSHLDRPALVLESLGIRLAVLSMVALSVTAGAIESGAPSSSDVGRLLFAVPFTALLVAATVSRTRNVRAPDGQATALAQTAPDARLVADSVPGRLVPARVLGTGILVAALSLVVLVAGGGLADVVLADVLAPAPSAIPAIATPAPTTPPREAYLAFNAHLVVTPASPSGLVKEVIDHLQTGFDHAHADAMAVADLVAAEGAWIRDHPANPCFAEAALKWQSALDGLGVFGQLVGGLKDTSTNADVDAASSALRTYKARYDEFVILHKAAASACGATAAAPALP